MNRTIDNSSQLFSEVNLSPSSELPNSIISLDEPVSREQDGTGFIYPLAETVSEGLIYSLSNKGRVDIDYIANCTRLSKDEVLSSLEGYIFLNPTKYYSTNLYEGWETADSYLSGNLIKKYKEAYEANKIYNGLFASNIKVLKKEINKYPKVEAQDIYVTLGTPWITPYIIKAFIRDVLKMNADVSHDNKTGTWQITKLSYGNNFFTTGKFGTPKMDALQIINRTLNQTPIVINKPKRGLKGEKAERNEKETLFAIDKQKLLIEEFENWVKSTPQRRQYIVDLYNQRFGCNIVRKFDGSFLKFPDMNKDVNLYDYQKNAIARIILTPNTLLAHDVGSGKTFEMIAAAHELKRMGLANKTMIVVPNNIVTQWEQTYKRLYPNAEILVVDPKRFKKDKRNDVLNQIIFNDFDAIIIAYSCFELIPLSPDQLKIKIEKEKQDTRDSYKDHSTTTSTVKRNFTKLVNGSYDEAIEKLGNREPGVIYFDDLGIDRLFVDEAHNFKNVPIDSNIRVLGLNKTGSKECAMMMEKVHYIQRKNQGAGIVFATGTPVTNSISDVFTMQSYLQQGDLNVLNIDSFNAWVSNFAETQQRFEIDVDTSSYRMATRFAKFHNLPELATLLSNIADFHHIDADSDLPDFDGYEDILIKETPEFTSFLKAISKRADLIRSGKPLEVVKKTSEGNLKVKDNMLLVTKDGRDAALDMRLVNPKVHYDSESKFYKCADKVAEIYHLTEPNRLTQLIFCDTSTPNTKGFNMYDELKRMLIIFGVRSDEIAYIHDANTESQRKQLFEKVNNGDIRVLIGSTFKLGLGVNVQEKLYAIHHLDIPWRPSDMVQREGRILRPGNTNPKVHIFRYIKEHSFDAYSWQLLETKQAFISKLLSSSVDNRDEDDIDDAVLNYAEVKALAIGNPLIKERVETNNEINRLINLQAKQTERIGQYRSLIKFVSENKPTWTKEIEKAKKDFAYIKENIDFNALKEAEEALNADDKKDIVAKRKSLSQSIFSAIFANANNSQELVVDTYQGFNIVVPGFTSIYNDKFFYLVREGKYKIYSGTSDVGLIVRMNNFLKGFEEHIKDLKSSLKRNVADAKNAQDELNKTTGYEDQIRNLKNKLAIIDNKLGIKEG